MEGAQFLTEAPPRRKERDKDGVTRAQTYFFEPFFCLPNEVSTVLPM